jgi:hypothetical protein
VVNLDGAALGPDGTLYLSVELPDNHFQLVAADPQQGRITNQVDTNGGGILAFASGSIWLGGKTDAGDCSISRMDPASFAVQATITVPCDIDRSVFTSLGQAIWFVDQSKVDDSDNGAVMRMIDPATNLPAATGAALPYSNGYLGSSPGSTSIIYGDVGKDVRSLSAGSSEFQSLGKLNILQFAVRRGAWSESFGTQTAILVGPGGGVLATVPVDGPLVGADDQAVYVSGEAAADGSDTLWRYPADGSAPTQIAQGAKVDTGGATADLGYFDNEPFLVASHQAVKIWLVTSSANAGQFALDLQWVALP